jgi:hypothetical protein
MCKGGLYVKGPRRSARPRRATSIVPRSLDLRANRLAFSAVGIFTDDCCPVEGLYLAQLDRRQRIIRRRAFDPPCSDDPCAAIGHYASPELDGSHLFWTYFGVSRELRRYPLRGGRMERALNVPGATVFTVDRGSLIYADSSGLIRVVANPAFG